LFIFIFYRSISLLKASLSHQKRLFRSTKVDFAKILASDPIEAVCGKVFTERGHELVEKPGLKKEELLKIIHEFDGLVVRSGTKVSKEIINAGTNLKVIGRAGTGVDNIDVPAATNKGILVVNTPGGNTISTAELTMGHILALARNIPQATASLKAGKWERSAFTGTELTGKVLGVIGVGKIGREVAKWCKGLGMSVVGYDPVVSEQSARGFGIEPVPLEDIYRLSDFITIHTPLTKETENLIDAIALNQCKKGVRIINCARGGIINETDLLAALNSGQVSGAGLDTLEVEPPVEASLELRKHPHVVMTPHLGASTFDAQERVAKAIAENMCDIFDGGAFVGVVNCPDLGAIARQETVVPYVLLGEKIGSMQGQLLKNNKIASITLNLRGKDVSDSKVTDVIKSAVIKGSLTELGIQGVSFVNAISIAEEMGLKILINLSEKPDENSGFLNTLGVELEIEGFLNASHSIEGTVFGKSELRIIRIDGFSIDLPPTENMLLFNNIDAPGVLRKVMDQLAANSINVGCFSVGRKSRGSKAMSAITLDTPLPDEVLKTIAKAAEISNVFQIKLKETIDPNFRVRSASSQGEVVGSRKPMNKPRNPEFSSGPCKKRPGYSLSTLRTDSLGRSHRSKLGKSRLKKAIEDTKRILNIPDDYYCGIMPASDTGAFEMAMWNMLGERPIDSCYWESFGKGWYDDITKHLKLKDITREFKADYGKIANLESTNPDHDILFTFNGTTSGVRVPNLDWISSNRQGLTFNDATSAAFAMDIDWKKVDITTFSWQKVLGGEGAHGMLILSPNAVKRLETFDAKRPLPKIFRMTKKDKEGMIKLDKGIFQGDTINTPSMLCVEDYLDALSWADNVGGLKGLISRSENNLKILEKFLENNDWIHFLAQERNLRSNTSVCLTLDLTKEQVKKFVSLLETEGVAYDIGSYRDAPDGLRIWCGATVEQEDLEALLPWLKVSVPTFYVSCLFILFVFDSFL
jgi:phosphoserine aminotransferase